MTLKAIKVGKRLRTDLGDLDELVESIKCVGLLHPLVVNGKGELIAGHRRMEAFRRLGRSRIPVTVVTTITDAATALIAEHDENVCRLDLTPEKAVRLGAKIEAIEKPKAAERMKGGKRPSGKFPEGETRDVVGAVVGMSGRTYEKAQAVVTAADADPKLRPIVDEMNRTGKVAPAHAKLRLAQQTTITDQVGQPIENEDVAADFARRPEIQAHIATLSKMLRVIEKQHGDGDPLVRDINMAAFKAAIENARTQLRLKCVPCAVCLRCGGNGCLVCLDRGWIGKMLYKHEPADLKQHITEHNGQSEPIAVPAMNEKF